MAHEDNSWVQLLRCVYYILSLSDLLIKKKGYNIMAKKENVMK